MVGGKRKYLFVSPKRQILLWCKSYSSTWSNTSLQQSSCKPPHTCASWTWSQPKHLSPKTWLPWRRGTWAGILPQHLSELWLRLWSSGGSLQTQPHLNAAAAEGFWCYPKDAGSKLGTVFRKQSFSRSDLQVCNTNSWLHTTNGFSSVWLMYRTNANKVFTFNLYCKHEIKSNCSVQEMIVWLATF